MKDSLPTESEITALHKKHAPSEDVFKHVYNHCLAVTKIAEQIMAANDYDIDEELVKAGCMLHDIGTSILIQPEDQISVNYANRGVAGAQVLKDEGLPKSLCDVVEHHVGHGLTAEHIKETYMPLPHRNLTPETTEERLVNYASKLHARIDTPQFNSVESYRKFVTDIGNEYYITDFESLVKEFGEPDLSQLAKELQQKLV